MNSTGGVASGSMHQGSGGLALGSSGTSGLGKGNVGGSGGSGGMLGSGGKSGALGGAGSGGTGGAGMGGAGMGGAATGGAAGGACDTSPGQAMQFHSQVTDMIAGDIGITDIPGGDTPRTLELWAKFIGAESWTAEQTIIELGRPNGPDHVWGIDMSGRNGGSGVFGPYTNGVSDNNGTDAPPQFPSAVDVGWLHLSWAYQGNGGKLEFTVNGDVLPTQVPGAGFSLPLTPGLVLLGASQEFGNEGWDGIMDEVRIWKVYRTPTQIKDNMKVFLKGTEAGLSAYYNFNETTGFDVTDVTKSASRTLKLCTAAGGACPSANSAMPTRVASDIPGPFTCAP